jgi:hypothetical protein
VRASRQDDWRNNPFKIKKVRNAIERMLLYAAARPKTGGGADVVREPSAAYGTDSESDRLEAQLDALLSLVKNQHEY